VDGKTENTLYYGDNLDILRRYIKDETVDLIYLDPPFKSNQDYNVLFKEQDGTRAAAQIKAFEDTWRWDTAAAASFKEVVEHGPERVSLAMQAFQKALGDNDMLAYLAMMAPRLVELRRVLKPTGSIYLHCDPAASHYLKMLMDAVFQGSCFRNELIWHYGGRGAKAVARQFPRNHDVVLVYAKGECATFHRQHVEERVPVESAGRHGIMQDDDGRWYTTAPRGDYTDESIEALKVEGRVHVTRTGSLRVKYFLRQEGGFVIKVNLIGSVWNDIPDMMHAPSERLGYPTQKPEALLARIIQASSNEGDLVLDPFCGCGTAIAVAQWLNRRWVGIDITHLAVALMKQRLRDTFGIEARKDYRVVGEPVDLASARQLAKDDPYEFQYWALDLVGARPHEKKKGKDRGIDGRLFWAEDAVGAKTGHLIISVKSGKTGPDHVRDLVGTIGREKAAIGVLITLGEPTRDMHKEAASAGFYEAWGKQFPQIQILTIENLLEGKRIDYPPGAHGNITLKRAQKSGGGGGGKQTQILPLD